MHREYHKWFNAGLGRDMELLVLGHAGARVLVFPTRDGRFYEYENIRVARSISDKLDAGYLQLFCVDSIDHESFYCDWAHPRGRIERHLQFENYILGDVFPFMKEKNPHPCTISHGCSLGAFHAANMAFRHPHLFQKLVAFSGRYDLTMGVEHFRDQFDGYYDEDIYFNTPTHFLANLDNPERVEALRRMDIVFTIGDTDPFLDNNRHLSHLLGGKGVSHQLHVWEGRAHSGYYWRRMAPLYL